MNLKSTFPDFYSSYKGDLSLISLWNDEANWTENDDALESIDILITSHYTEYLLTRQPEEIRDFSHSILNLLASIKNEQTNLHAQQRLRFLRLSCASVAIAHFNTAGQFHFNFDLFYKSLFDRTYANGEQYNLQLAMLWDLFDTQSQYIRSNIDEQASIWLGQLYYYSRSFSGLNDWCDAYYPSAVAFLTHFNVPSYQVLFAVSQLYSWIRLNEIPEIHLRLIDYLKAANSRLTWKEDPEAKETAVFQLTITDAIPVDVRRKYLAELIHYGTFDPAKPLQLYGSFVTSVDELEKQIEGVNTALRAFNEYFNKTQGKLQLTYTRARYFKLLDPLLLLCAENNRLDQIKAILCGYYDIDAIQGRCLIVLPNTRDGVLYCFDKRVIIKQQDARTKIPKIIETENRFLNIINLLKGAVQDHFIPVRDVGMPNPSYGTEFENLLQEYLDLEIIKGDLSEDIHAFTILSWTNLPIQPLMLKRLGKTLPNSISLTNKAAFPPIKKIQMWMGTTATSEIEIECMKAIFSGTSIQLTIIDTAQATKALFVDEYVSGTHDIIWIASHGSLEHYAPNDSVIYLTETKKISLIELYELTPKIENRRLIFLNMCEGGATTKTGEFKNVGFPEVFTCQTQDLLSHLWMVDPLTAAIFGVLFAIALSEGMQPFQAYTSAVECMLSGESEVIRRISPRTGMTSLVHRIQNTSSIRWNNIVSWGSPVYYV